jgi:hypothetical protein
MSFDIRRCTREDIDRIAAEAKAWRERNKSWLESQWEADLEANKDNPDPIVQHVAESFRKVLDNSAPEQLDLWKKDNKP